MAHEITETAGKAEMAYVGEVPWHGLGTKLDENADISTWIKAAGMGWEIKRTAMLYGAMGEDDPFAQVKQFDNREIFYRGDTLAPLGHGTDKFQIVQPREVAEFFEDVAEGAGLKLHTMGTLFGGRKFWALAKIDGDAEVGTGDRVGGYALLSSSCDGSSRTEGRFTSVRVVCNNTLSMARVDAKPLFSISHRSEFVAADAKAKMGLKVREKFGTFMTQMRLLADTDCTREQAKRMTVGLVSGKDPFGLETAAFDKVLRSAKAGRIMELFDGAAIGAGLDGLNGTAWGFMNAVTQFVDHDAKAKTTDRRLDSAWFGDGLEMKERALEMLLPA